MASDRGVLPSAFCLVPSALPRSSQGRLVVALVVCLGVAALGASGDAASPAQRGQPAPLGKVMQVKLDSAQAVLKALATEDFAALERDANRLGALTKQAEWGVLKTPEYARHSQAFLRATESLAASARAGDLNGATLDYATMTVRCVQCHRHVKSVRTAD